MTSLAPTITSGILAPAGTFISVRTERISEINPTTQFDFFGRRLINETFEHRPLAETE